MFDLDYDVIIYYKYGWEDFRGEREKCGEERVKLNIFFKLR